MKEEGMILEMTPLMQAKSLDSGSSGSGGDEARQGGNSLKSSRAAVYVSEVAVRSETVDDDEYDGECRSGCIGDSEEEGHQLLSTQMSNDRHPGFVGERGHSSRAHGSLHRSSSRARDVEEVMVVGGGGRGDEGQQRRGMSAFWLECLVPAKLLEERRTRAILFVYAVFSVRCGTFAQLRTVTGCTQRFPVAYQNCRKC